MASSVTLSGPIFTRVQPIMTDFLRDLETTVAGQALADVHQVMDASFRNPTPYYETQVVTQRFGQWQVVHDRGIVYGPWLESGGTRRRFAGYHMFRRATQSVITKIPRLAQVSVHKFLTRMNGP